MPIEGAITAIHGDVLEVEFRDGLPGINDAVVIKKADNTHLIAEVYEHTSNTAVKAIALVLLRGLNAA